MRIESLDAVRGIAALTVLFHHMRLLAIETPPVWIKYTPLRVLFSGQSAVLLFFVLSGFVLHLAFVSRREGYWPFMIKRFWRIYPPFCVAILASAALYHLIGAAPMDGLTDWANHSSWQLRPTFSVVAAHLAMTDIEDLHSLDNPMWSLVVEMRISILFPLIALATQWNWRATCFGALVISLACSYLEQRYVPDWLFDPLSTGRFLYLFAVGAAVAENSKSIRMVVQIQHWPVRLALWGTALALLSISPILAGIPTAIGSTLIVVLSFADTKTDAALATPAPMWLGKISYSLYLIHVPVLIAAAHLMTGRMPIIWIFAATVLLSLLIAELMYRVVERPAIVIGRRMADWSKSLNLNHEQQRTKRA
ncbi:acyltransferase [Bradyrhizobium sp. BR13661]|jgi:peptidoglycan/LPS O-acetylase OafA/YrhL|uniref:acyltransferase family protein n=1 Tax=Bradyrhizobium sp. BR13661 TaxID=2940622 RepID=UPI002476DBA4|nr:acyltransferase [Bradyrhizobium sp. BR13661]MDH6257813.1 peptidoglycan/LPS O-acetylase OafA/YrhL [Bradyrhizobium sp. BR13661]